MKIEKTEEQALSTLTTLCSRSEHCTGEMLEKMRRWNLSEEAQARVMAYLTDNRYVDDERFTRAFVKDKLLYNKWGRRKIEQALWQKHVETQIYQPILDEIGQNEWKAQLLPLLKSKRKSVKGQSDYEVSAKLIRFALGRGFTMDVIRLCLDSDEAVDDFEDEEP